MSTVNISDSAYGLKSGTSMAAPMAASAAAVVLAANPNLKPAEVIEILTKSADRNPLLEGKVKDSAQLNAHKAALMSIDAAATQAPSESPFPSDEPSPSPAETSYPTDAPSPSPAETPQTSDTPKGSPAPSDAPSPSPEHSAAPSAIPTPEAETLAILGAEAEQDRVKVKVFGSSDAPRSIICAAYDSGGIMLDVIFDTLPALDGTADITIPITLKNAAAFNIMIWDGGDSIKPLCENFILENNY